MHIFTKWRFCFMANESLIDNIKSLCKDKNITISQLEKEIGFGAGLISRWAKSDPSLSKIISIADFFNTDMDTLVGRNKQQNIEQEELLPLLIQMTEYKSITWCDSEEYSLPTNPENFEYFNEVLEIYFARVSNGFFYVVAQYEREDVKLDDIDIQIYVQPDEDSKPIPQAVNFNEADSLWLLARKNTRGLPDAYKANNFIKNFLKSNKKSE